MSAWRELLRHDLLAVRRATVWWTVGITAMALVNVAFWPSLEGSDAMQAFEDMGSLLEAFGAQDLASPAGYLDGQMFALMLPALLSGLAVTLMSGRTAGDEGAGRLEELFSLPVRRSTVSLSRWFATLTGLAIVATVAAVVVIATRPVFSLDEVGIAPLAVATLGSATLAAFAAAVAYVVAGFGGSRGQAAGLAVVLVVTGYLMALVVPINRDLRWMRSWSPWHWALGEQPVSDGVSAASLLGVVALTAAFVVLGTIAITRRDIHSP